MPKPEHENKRPLWLDPVAWASLAVIVLPVMAQLTDNAMSKLPAGSWQAMAIAVVGFAIKQAIVYYSRNTASGIVEAAKVAAEAQVYSKSQAAIDTMLGEFDKAAVSATRGELIPVAPSIANLVPNLGLPSDNSTIDHDDDGTPSE